MTRKIAYVLIFTLLLAVAGISGCSTGSNNETVSDLKVSSTSPADNANASRDTLVIVAFNKALNDETVTADNFYVTDSAGNKVSGNLEYFSLNYRIIFTSDNFYQIGETYTVYVKKNIESRYDETKLGSDYIFNFTVTE